MPTFSVHTRTSLPLPLGPLSVLDRGLVGEVESSCSHPREAMNLVHVRRISRGNRTASWFQHTLTVRAPSKRYVRTPGILVQSAWCSVALCTMRKSPKRETGAGLVDTWIAGTEVPWRESTGDTRPPNVISNLCVVGGKGELRPGGGQPSNSRLVLIDEY